MFDSENAIALGTVQGNRASCRREGEGSCVLSSCGMKTWVIFSNYGGDVHLNLEFVQ